MRSSKLRRAPTGFEVVIDGRLQASVCHPYVLVEGRHVLLTPIEHRLLQAFWGHRGQVLSPGFLLTAAWDPVRAGTRRSLWAHIRRLRQKIEVDPDHPVYIVTVLGRGYFFPVSEKAVIC